MFTRSFTGIWVTAAVLAAASTLASDARPLILPGATREELIEAYGAPTGRALLGSIEVLHYPHIQVRLANGRVERINPKFTTAPAVPEAAAPTRSPAPASISAPTPAAVPPEVAPRATGNRLADVWIAGFDEAALDAERRSSPILTLFTTSDASPKSRQFQQELVLHREFLDAFRARYVLLHVDFPVRTELPPEIREQNETLRDRLGVAEFPALLILSAAGEKLTEVEISDSVPGAAFRQRLILAVEAAHQVPVSSRVAEVKAVPVEPVPAPDPLHVAPAQITSGLVTARTLIVGALIVGTLIAGVMLFALWLLMRKLNKPVGLTQRSMASRISQAASGLPTLAEICAWPKSTLCHVTTRLAEREGYRAEEQPGGSDKDLVLKRPGDPAPQIFVYCLTGHAGVVPTRRVREMVGMLAADDVPAGWMIAPMGFAVDARAYAEQHSIRLIDGSKLLEQLGDLPSFALPNVLASASP